MATKAYLGINGSGKTYEVTSVVILGALRQGRRVVSNIAGLNFDAYREILIEEGVDPDKIGQLVSITHEQVTEEFFFRTDKDLENGIETFVQPGDLVALDEIWRFWKGFNNSKVPDRFMNFVRMHRQFVHPVSGLTCEFVIITQLLRDIATGVRGLIDQTYRMEKATAIGSTTRYRVDIFSGGTVSGAPLRQIFKEYEPKYFVLYQSHSQLEEGSAAAKEQSVDTRGNILKGALFKVVLPLFFVLGAVGLYFVWGFFHPAGAKKIPAAAAAPGTSAAPAAPAPRSSDVSPDWRLRGWYTGPLGMVALLEDNDGRMRHVYMPSNMRTYGLDASLSVDGARVTKYSGTIQSKTDNAPQVMK